MAIEYAMVIGYFFISMAIGLFCVGAVIDIWKINVERKANHSLAHISKLAITTSLPLVIVGILSTLFHLGKIGSFYNIILNFSSWLTREAWSAGIFTFCAFVCFLLWRSSVKTNNYRPRAIVGAVGIVFGITTIFSMSMIYMSVKAIPAWNTDSILYMNLANAFLLGVFLFGILLAFQYNKNKADAELDLLKIFTWIGLFAIILVGATFLINQVQISMLPDAAQSGSGFGLAIARFSIGILMPLLIVIYALAKKEQKSSIFPAVFTASFLFIIAGDIMSRMLHFIVAVNPPVIPPIF